MGLVVSPGEEMIRLERRVSASHVRTSMSTLFRLRKRVLCENLCFHLWLAKSLVRAVGTISLPQARELLVGRCTLPFPASRPLFLECFLWVHSHAFEAQLRPTSYRKLPGSPI